jgi:hypothetical protein
VADVSYLVEASLKVSGGAAAESELIKVAKASDGLGKSFGKMTGGLYEAAGGLANLATSALVTTAKVAGLAGAVALSASIGAAHAVGANLSMLEDKSIQLGSVIGAAAEIPFEKAKIASDDLFKEFRRDAISSAGETADFVNVASSIAGPLIGAGLGMNELHELTKSTMAAAPALGIAFDQAGTDVMRMLQGIAGAHEPLFRAMVAIPSLGIKKAEEFNKLSPEKRYEKIAQALGNPAFRDAANMAGQSMTGLLSTTTDVLKNAGSLVGGPLFNLVKKGLGGLTTGGIDLLDDDKFKRSLSRIGGEAEIGFRRIGLQADRIFPDMNLGAKSAVEIIGDLVHSGMDKLVKGSTWLADHWGEIKGYAGEVRDFITDAASKAQDFVKAMGGGDFATGAKHIAEALLAVKAAGMAAPVASGLYSAAQGAYGLVTGGAGAVAGAGGAAATAGGVGASLSAGAAAVGAAAVAALPYVLASAAVAAAVDQATKLYPENKKSGAEQNVDAIKDQLGNAVQAGDVEAINAMRQTYLVHIKELYNPNDGDAIYQAMSAANNYLDSLIGQAQESAKANAFDDVTQMMASSIETPTDALVQIYNDAALRQDTAMMQLAAGTLVASQKTAADLEKSGLELVGGLGVFANLFVNETDGMKRMLDQHFLPLGRSVELGARKAKAPDSKGGGGKQEITIKWDLGDGNDEAIFVRTRRQIVDTLKGATGVVRAGPLPGMGF